MPNLQTLINDTIVEILTPYSTGARQLVVGAVINSTQHVVGRRYDDVFESDIGAYGKYSHYPFKELIESCYRPMSDTVVNSPMLLKDQAEIDMLISVEVNAMCSKVYNSLHRKLYDVFGAHTDDYAVDVEGVEVLFDTDGNASGTIEMLFINDEAFPFSFRINHKFSTKGIYFPEVDMG